MEEENRLFKAVSVNKATGQVLNIAFPDFPNLESAWNWLDASNNHQIWNDVVEIIRTEKPEPTEPAIYYLEHPYDLVLVGPYTRSELAEEVDDYQEHHFITPKVVITEAVYLEDIL